MLCRVHLTNLQIQLSRLSCGLGGWGCGFLLGVSGAGIVNFWWPELSAATLSYTTVVPQNGIGNFMLDILPADSVAISKLP